ncbi:tetratricopeptide repeat protein [Patescibacteria group bacterium]
MRQDLLRKKTAILLLLFIGMSLYFNSFFNDFFISDDEDQILFNTKIQSVKNIPSFFVGSTYFRKEQKASYGPFYRPMMTTTYTLIYSLFGPDPLYFHLTQTLFHISNSIILLLFFSTLFPIAYAFIPSLLFLVHPINSETVLHSANLQDVLFIFFGLLALLHLSNFKKTKPSLIAYFQITLLLLLSYFSKETGLLFSGLIIIYAYIFVKKHILKVCVASFISVSMFFYFRFNIAGLGMHSVSIAKITHASFAIRLIHIPKIVVTYLSTFIFPWNISIMHLWYIEQINIINVWFPLILLITFCILFVFLIPIKIYKKAIHTCKTYVFFLLWFIIGLSLHLQIIPLEVPYADRYFYLPIIGLLGMLLTIYVSLLSKTKIYKLFLSIIICILIIYSGLTLKRTFEWRNSEILLIHDLNIDPGNYYLQNLLGTIYIRNENYTKAEPLIHNSIASYRFFGNINNYAIIQLHKNSIDEAITLFEEAIELSGNYTTYVNLANVLFYEKQDIEQAKLFTTNSLHKYPYSSPLLVVLAQSDYLLGNYDEALKHAIKANTIDDNNYTKDVLIIIQNKQDLKINKIYE